MEIEEIVKKHKRFFKYSNHASIVAALREELKLEGHHVKSLELTSHRLVIRTDNNVFVETF